jgi:tRNA pseudouridine55 synthase
MQGILLVDKPAGWTSFDVVNYVRRIVADAEGKRPKSVKVGHTGTLDPFATGLLVLLIGKDYTKQAGNLSKADKTYEVILKLGSTSTTGDPEGEIVSVSEEIPAETEIKTSLKKFTGEIQQVPPAYSAIKIDGQRAYKLARAGKKVVIEPRTVTINRLEMIAYSYPEVELVTDVSSGTYIRSLVEDLGAVLKTGAYTTALRRTKVGNYEIVSAVTPKILTTSNILTHLETL